MSAAGASSSYAAPPPALSTMRQLEERQVESEVGLLLWSPKMDVLALTLEDTGEVVLYRLNWQRVWTRPPPAEGALCGSLAWRPDGKMLAVGYDGGRVDVVDVEGDRVVHTVEEGVAGAVTALRWVECGDHLNDETKKADGGGVTTATAAASAAAARDGKAANREGALEKKDVWPHMSMFPQLRQAYGHSLQVLDEVEECQKLHDGASPTSLLVVGTDRGHVSAYMNGFLLCARVDVRSVRAGGGGGEPCSVVDVAVAPNLSTFSLVCKQPEEAETEDGRRTFRVDLLAVSVPVVSTCFEELERLSRTYSVLHGVVEYVTGLVKHISEAWEGIVAELDSKLDSYVSKLKAEEAGGCGSGASIMAAEFLELLLFGIPSVDLEQFMAHELTEKGLKKLITSIDASYLNMQRLVLKYLSGVSQSLVYYLGELAGTVAAGDKMEAALGISLERVREAQRRAAAFWAKGMELQQVIDQSRRSFRIFFRWLHVEILRLSEDTIPEKLAKTSQQEVAFLAEFFQKFDGEDDRAKAAAAADASDTSVMMEEDDDNVSFSRRHLEKVGQYLKDAPLEQPADRSSNPWHAFLDANPDVRADLDADGLLADASPRTSLAQERNRLAEAVDAVFRSMFVEMSDKCSRVGEVTAVTGVPEGDPLCVGQLSVAAGPDGDGGRVCGLVSPTCPVTKYAAAKTEDDDKAVTKSEAGTRALYFELRPLQGGNGLAHELSAAWLRSDEGDDGLRLIGAQFYSEDTVSLFLGRDPSTTTTAASSQRLVQLPLSELSPLLTSMPAVTPFSPFPSPGYATLSALLLKEDVASSARGLAGLADLSCHRELENLSACFMAVSGPRKVAAFLFRNRRRVRIYDMEVEEDDEDEDEEDNTMGNSGLSSELNTSQ